MRRLAIAATTRLRERRERREEQIRVRAFMSALGWNGEAIELEAKKYEAWQKEREPIPAPMQRVALAEEQLPAYAA